jgi:predicted CXXCH cytochrome family protein
MKKTILISLSVICYLFIVHVYADAKVTGNCVNCHTMHNSQNGTVVALGGPYVVLLVNDCLGCHSATGADIWQDSVTSAPIVYNINGAPTYGVGNHGLAGGNFYWVKTDDTKGHNVFSDNPDNSLNEAPGKSTGCGGPGPGSSACHVKISNTTSGFGFSTTRQGCTKCHMIGNQSAPKGYHHRNDEGPVIDNNPSGEGWYRFLDGHMSGTGHGVTGMEDPDWQKTYSDSDHNEYLGFQAGKTSPHIGFSDTGDTMTAFCCGCHGNFHWQKNVDVGPWIRHPSDHVIPNSGEYSSYTTYDPQVPVARPDLSAISDSSQVRPGTDMVMCLSCHRPHGSPYPDMLRWDYNTMVAGGGGSGGCFTCHSQKNQSP